MVGDNYPIKQGDDKMLKYIHKIYQVGIIRLSIYILGNKFCFRLEFSRGW